MYQSTAFKAKIRVNKPHFIQKALTRRIAVKDAYNPRFRSNITIFLPKLTIEHPKPCVFLNLSNGNGNTLIRVANIASIEQIIDDLNSIIHSDEFYEMYNRLEILSDRLIQNDLLIYDKQLLDVGQIGVNQKCILKQQ